MILTLNDLEKLEKSGILETANEIVSLTKEPKND